LRILSLDLKTINEDFEREGYAVLKGFFDSEKCDKAVKESEDYIIKEKIEPSKIKRVMNIHQKSLTIREMFSNKQLMELLDNLMKEKHHFLQTIYFYRGSEQPLHSDYVYMSTIPKLQLGGMWIALEDITEENGPLAYVPGSHKIPISDIVTTYKERINEIKNRIEEDREGIEKVYEARRKISSESLEQCLFFDNWLNRIYKAKDELGLKTVKFLAKKGDVLFWHANLLHGGLPINNPKLSRRSAVAHFLTKKVEKYFDMNYVDHRQYMTLQSIDVNRAPVIYAE